MDMDICVIVGLVCASWFLLSILVALITARVLGSRYDDDGVIHD